MYEKDLELTKLTWNHSKNYPTYSNFLKTGGESSDLIKPDTNKKLRFCYIDKIEEYPLSKPIKKALDTTIELLRKNGHQVDKIDVEKWTNPTWEFYMINNKSISCQMVRNQKQIMDKNILTNEPFILNGVQNTSPMVTWLFEKIFRLFGYEKEAG